MTTNTHTCAFVSESSFVALSVALCVRLGIVEKHSYRSNNNKKLLQSSESVSVKSTGPKPISKWKSKRQERSEKKTRTIRLSGSNIWFVKNLINKELVWLVGLVFEFDTHSRCAFSWSSFRIINNLVFLVSVSFDSVYSILILSHKCSIAPFWWRNKDNRKLIE